jgi:hypothetical protein
MPRQGRRVTHLGDDFAPYGTSFYGWGTSVGNSPNPVEQVRGITDSMRAAAERDLVGESPLATANRQVGITRDPYADAMRALLPVQLHRTDSAGNSDWGLNYPDPDSEEQDGINNNLPVGFAISPSLYSIGTSSLEAAELDQPASSMEVDPPIFAAAGSEVFNWVRLEDAHPGDDEHAAGVLVRWRNGQRTWVIAVDFLTDIGGDVFVEELYALACSTTRPGFARHYNTGTLTGAANPPPWS